MALKILVEREELDCWDRSISRLSALGPNMWVECGPDGKRVLTQRPRYRFPPCWRVVRFLTNPTRSSELWEHSSYVAPPATPIAGLIRELRTGNHDWVRSSERIAYAPPMNFLLDWAGKHGLLGLPSNGAEVSEVDIENPEADSDRGLPWFEDLRVDYAQANIAYEIAVTKAAAEMKYKAAVRYLDSKFAVSDELLIVQLDVGFCTDGADKVTVDQAKRYLLEFLNKGRARRKLFGHRIGYFWHMEPWDPDNLHFHLVLLFDGTREKRNYLEMATMAGEYWRDATVAGKGAFSNYELLGSGFRPNPYKRNLGPILKSDVDRRRRLLLVLRYITQHDRFLKVKVGPNASTFGHGEVARGTKDEAGKA